MSFSIPPLDPLLDERESLRVLYRISSILHSTLDPSEALSLIVHEMVSATKADSGSVALINPTNGFLEIQAQVGLPESADQLLLKVGEGITGWVAQQGKPICLGNAPDDPRFILAGDGTKSELAVPMEVDGTLRGVLNVDSTRRDAFTSEHQSLLLEIATQAALVIRNTWLYEQRTHMAAMFESLVSVAQAINSSLDLEETFHVITRESCSLMNAKMSSIMLLDDSGEFLQLRANHGAGLAYTSRPDLPVAESMLGIVVRRTKPMRVENVQVSEHYQNVEVAREEGLVSLLSVPLATAEKTTGVLNVYTSESHSFSNEEIKTLTALAQLSSVAIEKARLHQRIVTAEEQIRSSEQLSALGLLAGEVAHEIRNPLTVLKMLFHSLNLEFEQTDPRSKDLEVIEDKMNHLNKIVEQVLDFSRRSEPSFEWVDINELLEDLFVLTRHKLKAQDISLTFTPTPDPPLIRADRSQLSQAFLNLTLNAVEAMPNGGTLSLTTQHNKNENTSSHIAVIFEDNGHGFSKKDQEKAFSSLLTTTKPKGSGLGLAIVSRIIQAHQGQIKLDSQEGQGATFTVSLPLH